ncbi:B-cell receptor CD22-like [Anarhichas minor]|uniref:B-cell receptor CD22-like n=1 Tax=Anarhichas minor TaxID=65739 RepID=UPI003F73D0C0
MSSTAAAAGFVVFLLSVQVIQSQDDWGVTYTPTEVCAVKGSTVEIHCSYTYPSRIQHHDISNTFWFKEKDGEPVDLRTDSEYSGRVQYRCYEKKKCTLRLTDLRESDSAEYKFRFTTNQPDEKYTGSPGVTLSVTGLQVEVSRYYSTRSKLKCLSSCVLPRYPSYFWYKNEQKINTGSSSLFVRFGSSDSYSCAVSGYEDQRSPSVYAPKLPSVSVSPSAEIVEGSSVTLTCSSDANPAANYIWYKEDGNRYPRPLSKEPQLVFSSIQSSDSGQYYCRAENLLGRTSEYINVNVKYAPKLPSVSVSSSAEIVEGSSVTLTCSSDANPAANYTWYKEDVNPDPPPLSGEPQLVFSSIQSSDSGQYYCRAENLLGTKRSEFISIDVKYGPKLPSVSVSPSGEIVEGSSVTLTCSSDANPAANYIWYKEDVNPDPPPLSGEPQLVFSSIQSSDSGQYYCRAENLLGTKRSESISIDVKYAPKLPSVSVSPSAEIVEGSSVTLTCSSDANPAANYTWYKENQTRPHGEGGIYRFPSISSEDRGIYYCKSENKHGWIDSSSLVIDVQCEYKHQNINTYHS